MKITDIRGTGVSQLQTEQAGAVDSRAAKKTDLNQTAGADNINLSQEARLMQKAAQVIGQTPEVREEKVATLKEAVDQGTYRVDSEKVANSIIADIFRER